MASSPALPNRLSPEFLNRAKSLGVTLGTATYTAESLPLGLGSEDERIGILRGQITELCTVFEGGTATKLALSACVAAQHGQVHAADTPLLVSAFVDPARSLFAPGVAALGVDLAHLLVVSPPPSELARTTLKLARSRVFSLIVVDTLGIPGHPIQLDFRDWYRVVRQLKVALEGASTAILLLTDATRPRPLQLPVDRRLVLRRSHPERVELRVTRDRFHGPGQSVRRLSGSVTFQHPLPRSA